MTEELKELVENAPFRRSGIFNNFMFVSNGEYDGFWGKNGYDSIIILGFDKETEQYCKITDYADVMQIFSLGEHNNFNVDIPHQYGIPRIWFATPIKIDNEIDVSSVTGEVIYSVK